jgi:hypothetical protein
LLLKVIENNFRVVSQLAWLMIEVSSVVVVTGPVEACDEIAV